MPGYITHVKVLIDTVEWLTDVENALQKRVDAKKKLSPLQKTVLDRARAARQFLRYKDKDVVPAPEKPAEIKPSKWLEKAAELSDRPLWAVTPHGLGHGISRYAFSGAIGPDFPGAANILAINQGWVYQTLHWGSPKFPWVRAGSTRFIFNALDEIVASFAPSGVKPLVTPSLTGGSAAMTAAMIGHCSSVAAHVILHPFISYAVQMDSTVDAFDVENALDAQLSVGFFQLPDMHSGDDSWTDYFLTDKEDWTPFLTMYLQAFNRTYQGPAPADSMCELPAVADLKKALPELEPILKEFPDLEKSLGRYQGYEKLFEGVQPKLRASQAKKMLDQASKVKDRLEEFPCRVPKLDMAFLDDGWRNTVNWAIDAGYDHGPGGYRWIWFALLQLEGFLVVLRTILARRSFSTTLEFLSGGQFKHVDSPSITQDTVAAWAERGIADPDLILECVENSYDSGISNVFLYFGKLITGIPLVWDGLFGQGTEEFGEKSTGDKAWTVGYDVGYPVLGFALDEIVPKTTGSFEFSLGKFILDFALELLDQFKFGKRDKAKGEEGDVFGRQLWYLQLLRWPFQFVTLVAVLGIKSTKEELVQLPPPAGSPPGTPDPPPVLMNELTYNFRDFALSQVGPALASAVLVFWLKEFEKRTVTIHAGRRWPTLDVKPITPYLTTAGEADTPKKLTTPYFGKPARPQLFTAAKLQQPAAGVNLVHPEDKESKAYPADGSGAVIGSFDYTLLELFDHSKYLAGLLAMTAVNYLYDSAENKKKTRQIFADWNLDFRTDEEWAALLDTTKDAPGLLHATHTWWSDINAGGNGDTDPAVLNCLQTVFGVPKTTGPGKGKKLTLQYEDGTPMRHAHYEAVFGGPPVPGITDSEGVATIDAPADHGDSFQLILKSYPQQILVAQA